jgi:hypothetical protein
MNRQQIMTYAAAAGGVFLLFYWTHLGFSSAIKNTKSDISVIETKIEKSAVLAASAKAPAGKSAVMSSGLLSFLQTSAEQSGLGGNIGGIKPKSTPGAAEGATIRMESLNYSQLLTFLRSVERYGNLQTDNIKISKRYDDEKKLNLLMDVIKK